MQPIIKLGLTKSSISNILHTEVRYGTPSLGGIGKKNPFVIQGIGRIYFLIKQFWKSNPSSPLLWDNMATLQL